MRVAFLCTSGLDDPSPRGRWLPVAQELARRGHEPHLLMLHPTFDRLAARERRVGGVRARYVAQMHVYGPPGVRRYYRPLPLLAVALRGALALAAACAEIRPDIVHVAKPQPINGLAGILAARAGARLFVDCDDYEAGANRFGGAWQRRGVQVWEDELPRRADGVTVNTRFLYDRCRILGVDSARLAYVPNGAADSCFAVPERRAVDGLRSAIGLRGRPVVAYVGAVANIAHGVGLLLEAFALLRRSLPEAALLIAGDGDDRPALADQARALGLGEAVRWAGRMPHPATRACYALARCSVDPVHDTPAARARSPLKVVESLALGVPVVTGDVGDRRATLDGRAGLITAPGDPDALAAGLAALLADDALHARLAAGARARAEDFRWGALAEEWIRLYET